jgi:Zn-dependent protease with chaperone function
MIKIHGRIFLLALGLAFVGNHAVFAQGQASRQEATPSSELEGASEQQVSPNQIDRGPVRVPEPSEKAIRYYRSGNVLWVVENVWGIIVPVLFLFTGFSARIRAWAAKVGRKWFFVIGLYFILFTLLNYLIDFPLSYYQEFVRQHAYGLSNQTFRKWFGDSLKELAVGLVIGFATLWIPYLLLKKSPRRWWLYTSILAVPFICVFMLIAPVFIDPLFNDFGPMKNKALELKILALADQAGIEGSRVYEVNKSVDTKAINAYVNGFMSTKRIVLWDTILQKLDEQELLVVMGHEMGHYVLGHVIKGILFFSLLILATLYVANLTAGHLISRFKERFGFSQFSDIASLPLLILLINSFSLIVTPIALSFSRHQEHEADRFGLEITRNNHAAATAFVKLQQENLSNPRPGPLYKLWRSSHPPIGERIDFCNTYKPWERGEPLRYGNLFSRGRM